MIKKLTLLFSLFLLLVPITWANNIQEELVITPQKGDIHTTFEISANFKPTPNSKGVVYKFKPHDSAPSSDWRSTSNFKFRVHRKGTFRAHLLARDSDGNVVEKTQLYKVFDEIPRQSKIYISNVNPKLYEKVQFEVKVWTISKINRDDWQVRWDFDGDGNFDTGFQKDLKTEFLYETSKTDKVRVYPVAEILYGQSDSEKIRGDYIYLKKEISKTVIKKSKTRQKINSEKITSILEPSFENKYKPEFHFNQKLQKPICENCGVNFPQDINGTYKNIIQCNERNEVGQKVIFDVIAPPNIVSMRPDFKGYTKWDLDFKPKTHWWWIYDKPGIYTVTFQLKDIYGKTSIIRKKIKIYPSRYPYTPKSKVETPQKIESKGVEQKSEPKLENNISGETSKNSEKKVRIKVKVSHKTRKVFEKFLFDASESKGDDLQFEWKNPEGKYPIVYGEKQLFYFESPGEKIITLKITDKNGDTDEIEIPITVKKADDKTALKSFVPNLLGGGAKSKPGFKIQTGANVPRPKFDTGMRPGF